jgi:hypothetical protein
MSRFAEEGGVYTRTEFVTDMPISVSPQTLVANTNKTINIPATARAVHVYSSISAPVYFKLDAAWEAVPSGAAFVAGGFFPPNQESGRRLSEDPIGTGHTLNLISSAAGTFLVEFWS